MYRRLKSGKKLSQHISIASDSSFDLLRDGDQPFIYDIQFSKKRFVLEVYDTASPNQHWTTLQPDVVVLAFDISNRDTLTGLREVGFVSIYMVIIILRYLLAK